MTTTVTSNGVTFNSGFTQTEGVGTGTGDIGSYIVAYTANATAVNKGSTDAGSNLRYDTGGGALGINNTGYSTFYMRGSLAGTFTLVSYSAVGTWRVCSGISASNTQAQLWVRIS